MKAKIDLLWEISVILPLTGVTAALFLCGRVMPMLVAGVLPIPFLLRELRNRSYRVSIWALLAPFGINFAYSLLAFSLFTGLEPSDPRPVNPSLEFYLIAIAMLGVGLVRGLQIRSLVTICWEAPR